jgi:hypothetical protein
MTSGELTEAVWPNFFIVGAVKCGTTSLYEHLKRHPQVFFPEMKEPHFFSSSPVPPRFMHEHCWGDSEAYLKMYEPGRGYKAIGDASPSYLLDENAPRRILEVSPDAKIVVLLRDPVERTYSSYLMNLLNGEETEKSFMKALHLDSARQPKVFWKSRLYIEASMYYSQVQRQFDAFGRDRVLILMFDDLVKNPQEVVTRAARHIGVNPQVRDETDLSEPHNAYRMPRFRGIYRLATSGISKKLRHKLLPSAAQNWLRHSPLLYGNRKPPLDDESRRYLQNIFDPDITRLEELLGRKLPELRKSWV